MILIGGDLLDSSSFEIGQLNILKEIKVPIYFVTGNHEYYLKNSTEKINRLNEFNINLDKPLLLIVQHTVTTEINKIDKYFLETINAIKETNYQSIIISGNADAGSQRIKKIIKNSNILNYENLHTCFNSFGSPFLCLFKTSEEI